MLPALPSGLWDTPLLRASAAGLRKVKIVDPLGPCKRRRSGRQTETVQDFADRFRWVNGRNDAHSTPAAIAPENIHGKHTSHELSPGIIPGPAAPSSPGSSCIVRQELLPCGTVGVRHRFGRLRFRDDQIPPGSRWGEHPMVANQVKARRFGHRMESSVPMEVWLFWLLSASFFRLIRQGDEERATKSSSRTDRSNSWRS